MYPNTMTETERLNALLEEESPKRTDMIQWYIDNHDTSKMQEGVDYYFKQNKITSRNIYKYNEQGQKVIDEDATNNKLASGWHKLLVDQKTSYLVGDPITISSKGEKDIQAINDVLGDQFNDTMPELVKDASNKGREWLHPFIDEEGGFDYIVIPAQEGIPIYDNSNKKVLQGFIRFYPLDDDTLKIELWDSETVTYYERVNKQIVFDASVDENPQSHFKRGDRGYGWGKVPFIDFRNNEEAIGDLTFYKDFIDAYDNLMSDTTNTLEDIQDIFYVLKGYEDTNLAEFSTNLKRYKGVKTDADGGVDTIQSEVPMDSMETFLNRLVEDIYQFGQGVNTNTDKFGNSPSGIALKFLFSLLDMKANVLERKFSKALQLFMWFVCEYLKETGQGQFDYKDIQFTFNKSMLMNEQEQATIAQNSKGVISDETIMANHPWVTDVEMEKKRMEEQQSAYPNIDPQEGE